MPTRPRTPETFIMLISYSFPRRCQQREKIMLRPLAHYNKKGEVSCRYARNRKGSREIVVAAGCGCVDDVDAEDQLFGLTCDLERNRWERLVPLPPGALAFIVVTLLICDFAALGTGIGEALSAVREFLQNGLGLSSQRSIAGHCGFGRRDDLADDGGDGVYLLGDGGYS
jgi:hypothetical protein